METMDFNLGHHETNGSLVNPMVDAFQCKRRFNRETDGNFRNSMIASRFDVIYVGKGTRSEFIERIKLD